MTIPEQIISLKRQLNTDIDEFLSLVSEEGLGHNNMVIAKFKKTYGKIYYRMNKLAKKRVKIRFRSREISSALTGKSMGKKIFSNVPKKE